LPAELSDSNKSFLVPPLSPAVFPNIDFFLIQNPPLLFLGFPRIPRDSPFFPLEHFGLPFPVSFSEFDKMCSCPETSPQVLQEVFRVRSNVIVLFSGPYQSVFRDHLLFTLSKAPGRHSLSLYNLVRFLFPLSKK